MATHGTGAPSAWIQRWSPWIAPGARVLDVACGSGRHVRWFAGRGCRVTGVDRDAAAVAPLVELAEIVVADIESGPWPFAARQFDAVVVTNYLWRARLPDLIACVAPGGVLLYETFAIGQERYGKPSNPAFLLQPGELLRAAATLRVVAYEDGHEAGVPPRCVQRIAAVREGVAGSPPATRYGWLPEDLAGQVKSLDSKDPP